MQDTENSRVVSLGADVKETGHLEGIFTDMSSVKHDRIFNLYATGTQVKMCSNDKWEDRNPTWHHNRTVSMTTMSGSKQDCVCHWE